MIRKIYSAILISITLLFTNVPVVAFAADGGDQCDKLREQFEEFGGSAPTTLTGNCTTPGNAISKATAIGLTLAGAIAVLFIVIGGIRYMTAAGNPKAVETARKMLLWAVIGLAVIILATVIVAIVTRLTVNNQVL